VGYFICRGRRAKPPKIKTGRVVSCLCTPPHNSSHTPHPALSAQCFQLMSYKGAIEERSRAQMHTWISCPKTRRAHSCRGNIKEGMEVGRTHLSPSSTAQLCLSVFPCSFSCALAGGLVAEWHRLCRELRAGGLQPWPMHPAF